MAATASSDSLTAQSPPPDLEKLKRYFTEARQLTEIARQNSLQAIDYYDSDQYTPAELAALQKRRQPPIVVNRIKPAINGMVGVIERGRSDPRAWPREPDKADTADVATDVLTPTTSIARRRWGPTAPMRWPARGRATPMR